MKFINVKSKEGTRLHMRRAVVKSKTLCGRPMQRGWEDTTDPLRLSNYCAQCVDVAERLVDFENKRKDDHFAPVYGMGGDKNAS